MLTLLTYYKYLTFSDKMASELREAGIKSTVILDSSVGYVMEQVDFVMVGAEGVVESGGIINKVRFRLSLSVFFLNMYYQ